MTFKNSHICQKWPEKRPYGHPVVATFLESYHGFSQGRKEKYIFIELWFFRLQPTKGKRCSLENVLN